MTNRLPIPGQDNNTWGTILNDFLEVSHNSDGTLASNTVGSSQIQAGSISSSKLDAQTQTNLTAASTAVQSINGKTGTAVTLAAADVGGLTETIANSLYPQSGEYVTSVNGSAGAVLVTHPVTLVVAASNASSKVKAAADYLCTGTNDDLVIAEAIASLPSSSGLIQLSEGSFNLGNNLAADRDYLSIMGAGMGTTNITGANLVVGSTRVPQRSYVARMQFSGGAALVFGSNAGKFEDIEVTQATTNGISVQSFDGSSIYEVTGWRCKANQCGQYGIYIDSSIFNSEFFRMIVQGGNDLTPTVGNHGIYNLGTDTKWVVCHTYKNVGYGMSVFNNSSSAGHETQVFGGEFETNTAGGLIFNYGTIGTVIGSVAYGNTAGDFLASNASYITFTDVIARSSTTSGYNISLFDSTYCKVRGGTSEGGAGGAIRINGGSYNTVRDHQVISTVSGAPASIRVDSATYNTIESCSVDKGIEETGTSNFNQYLNNQLRTGAYTLMGTSSTVNNPLNSGTGAPSISGTAGNLYLNTSGTPGHTDLLYVCTGGTAWTAIL